MKKKKVLTISWGDEQIEGILRKVEEKSEVEFYHYLYDYRLDKLKDDLFYQNRLFKIPNEKAVTRAQPDLELLKQLEFLGDFTINNLILSDRVLCEIPSEESLNYASVQAIEIERVITGLNPDYVIGSFDTVLPGLAFLICKKFKTPYYAFRFSVIPASHLAICEYPSPNSDLNIYGINTNELPAKAKEIRDKWLNKQIVASVYVSSRTVFDILKRVPFHISELLKMVIMLVRFGRNKFTSYSIQKLIRQYLRKKTNIFFRNKKLFITSLPEVPFFFYGFHMQPESSIDVWAPFYSNQYQVVEQIARSMPTGHILCVKIHISDAENYSNSDLKKYKKIPNVKIVSPMVSSRSYLEKARMICSIQGTIGLEGALLGKPTIMFGDSPVLKFPSVSKVNDIELLPSLVKQKLAESEPSEMEILEGFSKYLQNFLPATSCYWDEVLLNGLEEAEVDNYARIFDLLNKYKMD